LDADNPAQGVKIACLNTPGATLMIIALCDKCLNTIEDDWKTGAEKVAEWQTRAQASWR
jgi:hypothetical protein